MYCIMYYVFGHSASIQALGPKKHRWSGAADAAPSVAGGVRTGQKLQPWAWSAVFIASMVCLQVASMVALADAFLDMSTHALRV
jgi:hypothetical protein